MKTKKSLLFSVLVLVCLGLSTSVMSAESDKVKAKPKVTAKKALTCEEMATQKKINNKTKREKYIKKCSKKQAKKTKPRKKVAKKATS